MSWLEQRWCACNQVALRLDDDRFNGSLETNGAEVAGARRPRLHENIILVKPGRLITPDGPSTIGTCDPDM